MKRAQDTLMKTAQKLGEVMYQQSQGQPGPSGPGAGTGAPGGAKEGEVVDAEFEDLGDKKS